MGQTQIIGAAGENAAAEWLEDHGFEIVVRNWRSGRYELDLVARRGAGTFDNNGQRDSVPDYRPCSVGTIHFIEVKTRDSASWESPEDAMTPAKRRAFLQGARAWLEQNPTDLEPQLDLVAVDTCGGEITDLRYIPEAVISRW
jgi:putative endonuclease